MADYIKKYLAIAFLLGLAAVFATPLAVYARPRRMGDMGFHGGISEGRHLPRTLETILLEQGTQNNRRGRNNRIEMEYREMVFLGGGEPVLFEGILELTPGAPAEGATSGTFTVEYRIRPSEATGDVEINRTMFFTVQYRLEGTNMIYTYVIDPNRWTETITTPEGTFTLDRRRSSFVVSIIEDRTPGVSYYRGDISVRLVYTGGPNGVVTVDKVGEFYGFSTAWSATETHRVNVSVVNDDWAIQYQIRPSVTVNKIMQWVSNEPDIISFEGNFRELHQSFAGLRYDIFVKPHFMWDVPDSGVLSLETTNVFEQLPAPDLSFIRGHPAEDDIARLFATQILTGEPRFFIPQQAITRGQFMTALARAIKLPVEDPEPPRARRGQQPVALTLFSDVDSNRPEFRYIQAITRAGIAFGRYDGSFNFDYPLTRQEAIVTVVRALGLASLGLNPTVVLPFADSDRIAYWATREVSVAHMLGIIAPDENGNLHPNRVLSKGEAATLLNHLLEYMRVGIVSHYAEQIVNIPR